MPLEKVGLEIRRGVWTRATDSSKVTGMLEMRPGGVQRKERKDWKGSQEDRHKAEVTLSLVRTILCSAV